MKNKKYMITFFALLFLIIVTAVIFIILVTGSKKDQTTSADGISDIVTQVPTQAIAPSFTTVPTTTPEIITELFPAPQIVDNEIKYGYIDKTGAFVINPSFEIAEDFHEGVALVTFNGQNCVIDMEGTVLYVSESSISEYSNGFAAFADFGDNQALYGYLDKNGSVAIDTKYIKTTKFNKIGTAYVAIESGKYALIDKTGKELETYELDPKYDYPWNLQDGYLVYTTNSNKYGVINLKGEEILEPIYSDILYLENGLFAVKKPGIESYEQVITAKQAIFHANGEQLTDYQYYDLTTYHDSYCSATDDTSTFFVGLDGKVADNLPKFDGIGTLRLFGEVIYADIDGEQFYCNIDGSVFWQLPNTSSVSDTITIKSQKLRPNRYVLVKYPQVEGLKNTTIQDTINSQLKSLFTDNRAKITVKEMLSVDDNYSAKLINNLLIIERNGYDYYFGAAHGMPIMDYYFIDINTGVFYQLKDLFQVDSDYSTKINQLIKDEITKASEEAMYFPESFTGIQENQFFRLEEDALIIYFYPYDIAAYAAGFPEFIIPFVDIMDYIDIKGAFWNCFQSTY